MATYGHSQKTPRTTYYNSLNNMIYQISQATTFGIILLTSIAIQHVNGNSDSPLQQPTTYSVDCSFPAHYETLRCGSILGDRQSIYDKFMEGCTQQFEGQDCYANEALRLASNLHQPDSIHNQTSQGFKTVEAPETVREHLSSFWQNNKYRMKEERWPKGATAVNHWASPSYVVNVEEKALRGTNNQVEEMQNAIKESFEAWIGKEMKSVATYGIRVHTEGTIVPPHVTRVPMMNSAIVNVAQDVDESWPFELYKRDGNAVNVTLGPGEMIMFESGSLIHGHPFPLKGRFVASMYFHFEPVGQTLLKSDSETEKSDAVVEVEEKQKTVENETPAVAPDASTEQNKEKADEETVPQQESQTEQNKQEIDARPEQNTQQTETEAVHEKLESPTEPQTIPQTAHKAPIEADARIRENGSRPMDPHLAAQACDLKELTRIAEEDIKSLFKKDENGWQPIHEAARYGRTDCVKLLVEHGADVNAITEFGTGSSPLRIALDNMGRSHQSRDLLRYLRSLGAVDFRPEL